MTDCALIRLGHPADPWCDTHRRFNYVCDDARRMERPAPTLVGEIQFSQPSGYGGFQMWRENETTGKTHWHAVTLYAWSDGVVTWKPERPETLAP